MRELPTSPRGSIKSGVPTPEFYKEKFIYL
jgi:hypothetical protein